MMMRLREHGVRAVVNFYDRDQYKSIEGWLWAETSQGIFVSLDKEGQDIRFFRRGVYAGMGGLNYEDRATFSIGPEIEQKIVELDRRLDPPIRTAISKLDHSLLKRAIERVEGLNLALAEQEVRSVGQSVQMDQRAEHEPSDRQGSPAAELQAFLVARVDDVVGAYRSVHEEMERIGIIDLLERSNNQIAELPLEYTLPDLDERWWSRTDGRRVKYWDKRSIEGFLGTLKDGGWPSSSAISEWSKRRGRKRKGRRLGGITVPVAVGVAQSVYTGLGEVADGFEKIGNLLDKSVRK
jgi:hypothetical protein